MEGRASAHGRHHGPEDQRYHFPPGTSKWNEIEHRMFCYITSNWRGRPLESHEIVVNLIASTTTTKGLRVRAVLDTDEYPTGIKVEDATMTALHLIPGEFHGDWNYTIAPMESGGRITKHRPPDLTDYAMTPVRRRGAAGAWKE